MDVCRRLRGIPSEAHALNGPRSGPGTPKRKKKNSMDRIRLTPPSVMDSLLPPRFVRDTMRRWVFEQARDKLYDKSGEEIWIVEHRYLQIGLERARCEAENQLSWCHETLPLPEAHVFTTISFVEHHPNASADLFFSLAFFPPCGSRQAKKRCRDGWGTSILICSCFD